MSLKTRLVSLISAFALILTMLIMGVLAVSQVNVNMGGNISFTADDVYAHVTGNVAGAIVPPSVLDVTYSATKTTGDDTVWKKLDLNFNTSATPIVFSITVENLSTERTLTVTLTDTISAETPNLLKTIKTTSGAYTSGDIITLDPQGQANDTVQFTLTLSVEDKNTSLSNASFGYDLQLFDVSVAPEPPEITGFTFTTLDADATATLTSYTGSEANVVIPSSFSILDGKYVEGSDYIVTAIGDRAFYNCKITSITIPDSVTSIGDEAFYNCYALTEVNFGEDSQLASIGEVAFYKCTSMTNITIPEGVTRIGQHAFNSCSALTEVNFGADSLLKSIGGFAFNLCLNLTSIIIPKGVTSIGSSAFGSCYALAEVYNYSRSFTIDYNKTSNGYLGYCAKEIYNASALEGEKPATKIENDGTMQYYVDGATKIALAPAVPRESLISVTLHPDTTEINQYAFSQYAFNCTSMTNITIPASVTSIGDRAFYYCDALTEVNISADSQLTSIGEDAFYECNNLTSITIPEGVISIGSSAFNSCYALAEVYNYSSLTIDKTGRHGDLGYYAQVIYNASDLEGAKPATKIVPYDNVQYYVDGATRIALVPAVPRESLTSVTLHPDTTEINQRAFSSCYSLTSITIPDSVISIGDRAFNSCYALAEVYNYSRSLTIDYNTTSNGRLGYYAKEIYNASALEGAKPATKIKNDGTMQYYVDGTTRIALAPAVPRKSLISVTLHPDTTEINQYAFYECSNLPSITIPDSVTSIGDSAFSDCSALVEVNISADSLLKSIGEDAFQYCTGLTSITIPERVTSIGWSAFYNCTSLATVTIDSGDIYKNLTSDTACGRLIENATTNTIRVLASIINSDLYTNDYLNNDSIFEKNPTAEGGYYEFTRK